MTARPPTGPPKPPTIKLTEEEFVTEASVAGFLGAYKFWSMLSEKFPDDLAGNGAAMLKVFGAMALEARGGLALTPQEEEAFQACGLNSISLFKR